MHKTQWSCWWAFLWIGFISSNSWAAQYSLVGLGNISQSKATDSTGSYTSDGNLSYGGGILAEHHLGPMLGIELGALYLKRAADFSNGISFTSYWAEVPLLAKAHLHSFSVGAGGYYARQMGAAISGLKNADYGAEVSLGFSLMKFFVDARYLLGMANVSSQAQTEAKFTNIELLLGFHF